MMRNLLLTIFCVSVFLTNIQAQWADKVFNLSYFLATQEMEFADADNGFVVGVDANLKTFIVKTTNGGNVWTLSNYSQDFLVSLSVVNSSTVYAGGMNALSQPVLLKTTDGGNIWMPVSLPAFPKKLQFLNANDGFLHDNAQLMKTLNGGTNWNAVNIPSNTTMLLDFQFIDSNKGFALIKDSIGGTYDIHKTINGGNNWSLIFSTTAPLHYIHFYDEQVGVAYSIDEIYYTNNGTSWNASSISKSDYINEVKMISPTVGFVADQNYVLKTENGGANWWVSKDYSMDFSISPTNIAFPTSTTGYIAGLGSKYLKTTNTGGVGIEEVHRPIYIIQANERLVVTYDPAKATGALRADLFNILGQRVITEDFASYTGSFDLNISNLSQGTYILNITYDHKSVSTRIIIHK